MGYHEMIFFYQQKTFQCNCKQTCSKGGFTLGPWHVVVDFDGLPRGPLASGRVVDSDGLARGHMMQIDGDWLALAATALQLCLVLLRLPRLW